MPTHIEALSLFERGPAILTAALDGVSDAETTFVPAPGKWNIRQIVRHTADTEIVVAMRLRQIVAEEKPVLMPFDQDAWAINLGYENTDVFSSLHLFSLLRNDTFALLASLPETAFDRFSVHPERGNKTLLEWVTIFGRHVETHARQVRAAREAWLAETNRLEPQSDTTGTLTEHARLEN